MSDNAVKKESDEQKEKYKTLAESSNGRWWEFYLVRYSMGTVVASLLIFFFLNIEVSSSSNNVNIFLNEVSWLLDAGGYELLILPVLGLAYCYLASAPILVMHAARSVLVDTDEKVVLFWLTFCAVMTVSIMFFLYHVCPFVGSTFLLFIVFFVQYICIYISIDKRNEHYKNICTQRGQSIETGKEFVESYKHLREHGNAFMIIIMEIVLAVILYGVETLEYLLVVILVWVFPAAYVWFIGSYLEDYFRKGFTK